jgi:hypothetical protein
MRVGGQRHTQAALPPGRRSGTECIGGWVGPRAGLDRCGKSRSIEILVDLFKCLLHNNTNRFKIIRTSFGQIIVQNEAAINDARRKAK